MAVCRMDKEQPVFITLIHRKVKLVIRNIMEDFFFSSNLDLIEEFDHIKVKYKEVTKL